MCSYIKILILFLVLGFIGCKTISNPNLIAYSCGTAAGYSIKLSSIDKDTLDSIIDMVDNLKNSISNSNDTTTWYSLVDFYVNKNSSKNSKLLSSVGYVLVDGLIYLISSNPELMTKLDKTSLVLDNFCTAFLIAINKRTAGEYIDIDMDIYDNIRSRRSLR